MRTVRTAEKSKSIKIPERLYNKLREIALKEGRVIVYIVAEAIEEYLKKRRQ